MDPVKDGMNWYVYCSNNPLRYMDPDGLEQYEFWEPAANALKGGLKIAGSYGLQLVGAALFGGGTGVSLLGGAVGDDTAMPAVGAVAAAAGVACYGGAVALAIDGVDDLLEAIAMLISMTQGGSDGDNNETKNNGNEGKDKGYTEGQYKQFKNQLEQHGEESLLKSRQTFKNRIIEHLQKITEAQENGGYTSSMLREINNWEQQIKAIDDVLGEL